MFGLGPAPIKRLPQELEYRVLSEQLAMKKALIERFQKEFLKSEPCGK